MLDLEKHKSLSQALRKRKKMQFTLSDSARRKIHLLAHGKNMSQTLEGLILGKK